MLQMDPEGSHDRIRLVDLVLGSSLTGKLLIALAVFSLTPLIIIVTLSDLNFRNKVERDVETLLFATAEAKANSLHEYFHDLLRDVVAASESPDIILLLDSIESGLSDSNLPVADYVGSFDWEEQAYGKDAFAKLLRNTYGYYDVLLCDVRGNILFTIEREEDLGDNLLHGNLVGTGLADAYEYTLLKGRARVSDFEFYGASGGVPTGFVTSMIVDIEGSPLGVIALQIPVSQLNHVVQTSRRLGENGEVYLIGSDLVMRSDSVLAEESTFLKQRVETDGAQLWAHTHGEGQNLDASPTVRHYTGYRGNQVIGTSRTVSVGGINLGVIVEMDLEEAFQPVEDFRQQALSAIGLTVVALLSLSFILASRISRPLREGARLARRVAGGDLSTRLRESYGGEIGDLSRAMNRMSEQLLIRQEKEAVQKWVSDRLQDLRDLMQSANSLPEMLELVLRRFCVETEALSGAIYLPESEQSRHLTLWCTYAISGSVTGRKTVDTGEGLLGQAALEKQPLIVGSGDSQQKIVVGGMSEVEVRQMRYEPVLMDGELVGILELAYGEPIKEAGRELLDTLKPILAVGIRTGRADLKTLELLSQTRTQAQHLQEQGEELRAANEQLGEKSEELLNQQEELRASNEELEEQRKQLHLEREALKERNLQLQQMRDVLQEKAVQLEESTHYKSRFLANMSHELRTPLNSILLLSRKLATNSSGSLDEDEVHSVEIIAKSGENLLELINEILDLSKIEAREVSIHAEAFSLRELATELEGLFTHMAEEKGLGFAIEVDEEVEDAFLSDKGKVGQVLRNLISNAIKYTEKGTVQVWLHHRSTKASPSGYEIVFEIEDTGLGIAKEDQARVFEAFAQLDSGLARKSTGTGLGLSICRNLAELLGGRIELESEKEQGSVFRFFLPPFEEAGIIRVADSSHTTGSNGHTEAEGTLRKVSPVQAAEVTLEQRSSVGDDRDQLVSGRPVVLVVEDDPIFATILRDSCRKEGTFCLVAGSAEEALQLLEDRVPQAILLDMQLPGMSGDDFLATLQGSLEWRHLPVHIISGTQLDRTYQEVGVLGVLQKPIDSDDLRSLFSRLRHFWEKPHSTLLLLEKDPVQEARLCELFRDDNVLVLGARTGEAAMKILQDRSIDCVIADLDLDDVTSDEFFEAYETQLRTPPPLIVYGSGAIDIESIKRVHATSGSVILKGVKSEERLVDETALLLHRVVRDLPETQQQFIANLYDPDKLLNGKRVLIVDDDMRNLYSISKSLRAHGMIVEPVDSGEAALKVVETESFDIILMDLMMPGMHGLETIQAMREREANKHLEPVPIVVTTAKAMPEDREACIAAGATDFMSKPLELEKLFSLIRIWLY
jgi:signal transduction histidine kinase/DNA-binding response OmpR family regulator/HAMP domain-containing protein